MDHVIRGDDRTALSQQLSFNNFESDNENCPDSDDIRPNVHLLDSHELQPNNLPESSSAVGVSNSLEPGEDNSNLSQKASDICFTDADGCATTQSYVAGPVASEGIAVLEPDIVQSTKSSSLNRLGKMPALKPVVPPRKKKGPAPLPPTVIPIYEVSAMLFIYFIPILNFHKLIVFMDIVGICTHCMCCFRSSFSSSFRNALSLRWGQKRHDVFFQN